MAKEHYFKIKIVGKSTLYDEAQITELIYEFLKNKAEFQII